MYPPIVKLWVEIILRFHFNGNSKALPANDGKKGRLFKIRALFEKIRQNCTTQITKGHKDVEEQIIPFKRRSYHRRYIPNNQINGVLLGMELQEWCTILSLRVHLTQIEKIIPKLWAVMVHMKRSGSVTIYQRIWRTNYSLTIISSVSSIL